MILFSLAAIVVIMSGLKAASSVVVPFLLAIFIAVVASPIVGYIQKIGIPRILSFIIVTVCFFGILAVLGDIVFYAVTGFTSQLPEFQSKFKLLLETYIEKINSFEMINIDMQMLGIDPNSIVNTISSFLRKTSSILSMSFFIFLMVAFMLFETQILKEKVEYLSRRNYQAKIFAENFIFNLKRYLLIKTVASTVTGLIIGVSLWILGVPYAALWGVVAYVLNYIPTIGSIFAAIPALFISLVTSDITTTVWVLGIFICVNIMIGNIIEPRFMGEGLGISTIMVLFSLLVWGYVLGIGGLFLAVPLTMSIQIALNSNPKTKFIAVLMSNKIED